MPLVPAKSLGRRDCEILFRVALGLSDKEIACDLNLGVNTIRIYLQRIRDKIGNFERADAPGLCLLLGICSIADITRNALELLTFEDPASPKEGAKS